VIKRYQSNYSNEVHQLIVSPSKHYYVAKNGTFKYQKKPFEINLKNVRDSKKNHVIHFLIRDHFSGLFYWEICSADSPLLIHEFLYRAWRKKESHPLYGIPDFLTIPKNVQSYFPNIVKFIEKIGVTYIKVTSGFQGGVRDIRTIENELRFVGLDYGNPFQSTEEPSFELVLERMPKVCARFIDKSFTGPSKKAVWESGFDPDFKTYFPKNLESFDKFYQED